MQEKLKLASELYLTRSVFFGEADRFEQAIRPISSAEMAHRLGLALLLFDHVVLTAAYYWQSRQTTRVTEHFAPFVEKGSLLFAIRGPDRCRDCLDYFEALAGPGDLRSLRPWFETPERFTHAILDSETAVSLVEME